MSSRGSSAVSLATRVSRTASAGAFPASRSRAASATRPLPRPVATATAGKGAMQERPPTRAEQASYKELASKASRYEREVGIYERMQARYAARGDAAGEKFYRLMAHAAKSQLNMLGRYNAQKARLSAGRKAARAEADAKKTAKMVNARTGKPTMTMDQVLSWAREHHAEIGRGADHIGDVALAKLWAARGYDATPHVATKSQMNRLVDELGAREFYHGFNAHTRNEGADAPKRYATQFMKGAFHASTGVHGNGFYVAAGAGARSGAHYFAEATNDPAIRVGAVMRGALVPGASMISFEDAARQMKSEGDAYNRTAGADSAVAKLLYSDVGRYATYKGYDALGNPNGGYWVILNRGAVIAQRSLEKPSFRVAERGDTTSPRPKSK